MISGKHLSTYKETTTVSTLKILGKIVATRIYTQLNYHVKTNKITKSNKNRIFSQIQIYQPSFAELLIPPVLPMENNIESNKDGT